MLFRSFEAQLKRARTRLPAVSEGACRLLAAIGVEYHQLSLALGAAKGPLARPAAEIKSQIKYLIYKEFLKSTPWESLAHLPRYLQAMQRRLENTRVIRHAMRGTRRALANGGSAIRKRSTNRPGPAWSTNDFASFAGNWRNCAFRCMRRNSKRRILCRTSASRNSGTACTNSVLDSSCNYHRSH